MTVMCFSEFPKIWGYIYRITLNHRESPGYPYRYINESHLMGSLPKPSVASSHPKKTSSPHEFFSEVSAMTHQAPRQVEYHFSSTAYRSNLSLVLSDQKNAYSNVSPKNPPNNGNVTKMARHNSVEERNPAMTTWDV